MFFMRPFGIPKTKVFVTDFGLNL